MRQRTSTALIAAAAAVMSATYYAAPPSRGAQSDAIRAAVDVTAGTTPKAQAAGTLSSCKAYMDAASPDAVDASAYGDALRVWNRFTEKKKTDDNSAINYVIAFAPDPIHTQLSLYFDRTMQAIQAAAADEGYVYDSSWLPWQRDSKSYPIRSDQEKEKAANETQESCPGLLLFRNGADDQPTAGEPYSSGLAVFVVGDEPTKGVNSEQWETAVDRIVESSWKSATPGVVQILGPTFSGSLPSLRSLLEGPAITTHFQKASIYSGSIWSCDSILHFQRAEDSTPLAVDFGVFSENSELQIYRLLMYFRSQKQNLTDVAIISEDETAYGASDARIISKDKLANKGNKDDAGDSCHFDYGNSDLPVWLFYPRDISAVRAAYLEQSIFSKEAAGGTQSRGVLTTLRPTTPGGLSTEPDTITSYAGDEVSLDEEADLYELVSFLRSHHTHYLLLRCSNPDDFLFLTRFFHHAYPEGRIITLGSDELFRREADTSEFRGVMALTNYPLLPREQHWTRLINSPDLSRHVHRVFSADTTEGEYLAARFIFRPSGVHEHGSTRYPYALQADFKRDMPDYADPIWLLPAKPINDPTRCQHFNPCYLPNHGSTSPSTWLVAMGRDGSWPISVLNDDQYSNDPKTHRIVEYKPGSPRHRPPPPTTVAKLGIQSVAYYWPETGRSSPVPWRVALFVVISLSAFHVFGMWHWLLNPRDTLKAAGLQEIFLSFRPSSDGRKEVLLGISNAIPFCAALLLLLGPCLHHEVWGRNYGQDALWAFTVTVLLLFSMIAVALILCTKHRRSALTTFLLMVIASGWIIWFVLKQHSETDQFSLLYRSAHVTSGVSPALPILLLLIGLYVATMLSLDTIDLLLSKPVRLPRSAGTSEDTRQSKIVRWMSRIWKRTGPAAKLPAAAERGSGPIPKQFSSISLQLGCQIDDTIVPLGRRGLVWLPPVAIALLALWLFSQDARTLTLEGSRYSFMLLLGLTSVAVLAMIHALRLHQSWIAMRLMLRALGRQPLRRTFAVLRECPNSSVWALGSGARGEQLRGLSNQLESLSHLNNSLKAEATDSTSPSQGALALPAIEMCLVWGRIFMEKNGAESSRRRSDNYYRALCRWLGRAGEDVINWILLPAWNEEQESLNAHTELSKQHKRERGAAPARGNDTSLSASPIVRAGEEFVCNIYITYIKTILSCMRSSAKSVAILFLAIGAAISSYPILSRTTVVLALLLVFVGVFIIVARVFVEMARDEILSLMTGTNPGELGGEFWAKIIGFGIGPIAGLVAAQFPAVAETIFSVLGPSLNGPK